MKKIILCFALFQSVLVLAQDQLFKRDNTKTDVKIIEMNQMEIKYKLFTYLDGPTIIVAKSDVALIIYQNGVHEVLNTPVPTSTPTIVITQPMGSKSYESRLDQRKAEMESEKAKFEELSKTKNLVGINIMEFLNGCIGVTYLREFTPYLNVYVPLTVGFTDPFMNNSTSNIYNNQGFYRYNRKTIEVGLGVNIQTSGKRSVTHFVGPLVTYGQLTGYYTSNNFIYSPNGGYNQTVSKSFVMNRLNVMINNGLLIRATPNFNIMLNAAFGYRSDTFVSEDPRNLNNGYYYNVNVFPINAFKFGLTMGYRF